MDRIEIAGLRAFGHHGVFEDERERGQRLVVDLTLHLDLSAAADSDSLEQTVDYGVLAGRVADAVRSTSFSLLETLADHLAALALDDAKVVAVDVRVAKPEARLDADVDEVAVAIRRSRRDLQGRAFADEPPAEPPP